MKYYIVKVKMGHVGRNYYIPMDLAIAAADEKAASELARKKPGVKRNHKDWCLEIPKEITYEQYLDQLEIIRNDPYWNKKTRQNLNLFKDRIVLEKNYSRDGNLKTNKKIITKRTSKKVKVFKIKKNEPIFMDEDEEEFNDE